MIIGFTQRRQFVSESDAPFGSLNLTLDVRSLRVSEREYGVQFRVLGTGNATVEAINVQFSIHFDALFGVRYGEEYPIEDYRRLFVGSLTSSPLITTIINDFVPEDPLKCYEIRIVSPDEFGFRDIFTCNEDENNPMSFFCLHTICIEDDDG